MSWLNETIATVYGIDPQAPAIESDGVWWTYRELSEIQHGIDAILARNGLGAGTRVGGLLRSRPECAALIALVVSTDRCVVTLNPTIPDDRLAEDIVKLKLPVVVGGERDWERPAVRNAAEQAGSLGILLPQHAGEPVRMVEGLETVGIADPETAPGISVQMLTSGTTGTPKRIPLAKRLLEQSLIDAISFERDRQDGAIRLRDGVGFVTVPFAHIGGAWSFLNSTCAGRRVFMMEKFALEPYVDGILRHRPPALSSPPTVLRMILDAKVPREYLQSVRAWRTSTAPLDPDLADRFHETYGIPVLQNYGATEFAGSVAGWTLADFKRYGKEKRGAVGRIVEGFEARTVHPDTREPVPSGEEGLLAVRASHLGQEDRWVETNDRAVLDEDGFLWIKGRYDNAIIRGGFKILADDVAKAIDSHPAIREAAVGGIPDPRLGEVPVAAYIVSAGHDAPSDEELKRFLRDKLPPYQVPVAFRAVDELPRTPSMKVSMLGLRELFADRTAA